VNTSQLRLRGRTALITGAGGGIGGIGRGIALALAAEGANVVIAALHKATGNDTAALIARQNGTALVVHCDVSVRTDVESAVSAAGSTFGGLDIVVHNAVNREGGTPLPLEEITDAKWDVQASVAWDASYFLAQAALPYLKRSVRGCFIMLGSAAGLHGAATNPIYSALKGGIRGFVKALAREWGIYQITVNGIQPVAATELTDIFAKQNTLESTQFMQNFPMGRLGRPREDIGRAVIAICSDDFGFVTGQSIQVDGGFYTAV
jgi:3-oxoacyl-[acyl-carrier protein] reductase